VWTGDNRQHDRIRRLLSVRRQTPSKCMMNSCNAPCIEPVTSHISTLQPTCLVHGLDPPIQASAEGHLIMVTRTMKKVKYPHPTRGAHRGQTMQSEYPYMPPPIQLVMVTHSLFPLDQILDLIVWGSSHLEFPFPLDIDPCQTFEMIETLDSRPHLLRRRDD